MELFSEEDLKKTDVTDSDFLANLSKLNFVRIFTLRIIFEIFTLICVRPAKLRPFISKVVLFVNERAKESEWDERIFMRRWLFDDDPLRQFAGVF